MKMHSKASLAIICAVFWVSQPAHARSASASLAWVGSWRLNLSHSKFSGAAPRAETRTIAVSGERMSVRSTGVGPSGKPIHFNYSVTLDGRFHPLVGNPDGDRIAVRLANPRKILIRVRRGREPSATATTEVSGDRLVMERHRLKSSGAASDDTLVYDRVR